MEEQAKNQNAENENSYYKDWFCIEGDLDDFIFFDETQPPINQRNEN